MSLPFKNHFQLDTSTREGKMSLAVNVGLVLTSFALIYGVVRLWSGRTVPQRPSASKSLEIGQKLPLPAIDWTMADQTLVIVLKQKCAFCQESAPFYRQLQRALKNKEVQTIVILPDTDTEAAKYVAEVGLEPDYLRQENVKQTLEPIGMTQVPLLLLVDRQGVLTSAWGGLLNAQAQVEVFKNIGLEAVDPIPPVGLKEIDQKDIETLLKRDKRALLLDVRDRESYARGHFPNARNIPFDELQVRAVNEIDIDSTLVIYSYRFDAQELASCINVLKSSGFKNILVLKRD